MRTLALIVSVPVILANAGAALVVFGDAPITSGAADFLGFFGNAGALGMLGWYLWYTQSRSMPADRRHFLAALEKQAEMHQKAIEKNQEMHQKAIETARSQFMEVIERERCYHNEQQELLRSRVHEMANAFQASQLKLFEALNNVYTAADKLVQVAEKIAKRAV